ncbi:MAG: glycosyltransferase family 4 protein [Candidatus Micrarchaeia archaeon]|jgi:glycosyltransferase involved in cell wall biosynthesis
MKVALVTPYDPATTLGGQERMLLELSSGLSKKGVDAHLFSLSAQESKKYAKFGKLVAPFLLKSKKWDFSGFDIVQANGWASEAVLGQAPLEKTLVTLYGTIAQYMQNVGISPLMRAYNTLTQLRFERRACREAPHLASLCRKQSEEMHLHYGCPPSSVRAINCGIDTGHFTPKGREASRQRLGLTGFGKIALACGRMSMAHKGFDTLLLLAGRMKENDLLLVNGSVPESLQRLMPKNMLARRTDWKDMPYLYSAADVLVHPSRYEGFGLVAAEAMACATPAVAFDTGAAAELIGENRGGVLVRDIRDSGGFVDSALTLLSDEALSRKLGKAAQARASKFTVDVMVNGYLDYYKSIMQG